MFFALSLVGCCAFCACGVAAAQQPVRRAVQQADTLRAARPSWLFVPLDSLRTADIMPPRPIRSVFADSALRADSAVRRKVAPPWRFVPVWQDFGMWRGKAR